MAHTLLLHIFHIVAVLVLITANTARAASAAEETSSTQMPAFLDFINPFAKPPSGAAKNTDDWFETNKDKKNADSGAFFFALGHWSDAYLQKQGEYLRSIWAFPGPGPAWVDAPYIDLHTGPDQTFPAFYIVEKEERILLLKTEADWVKIQAPDGTWGWVESSHLLKQVRFSPPQQTNTANSARPVASPMPPTPFELSVSAGDFEHDTLYQMTLSRTMSPHFSLALTGGDIINSSADSQFIETSLRYYPSLPFTFNPYFRLGMGRFFHPAVWTEQMANKDNASFVTAGFGADYPLSSQLLVRLDASNYSTKVNNTPMSNTGADNSNRSSLQAYTLGLAFRPEQVSVHALQQRMGQGLHHNDMQAGVFTGVYAASGKGRSSAPVRGLYLNYLLSSRLFIEGAGGETQNQQINERNQNGALSYYRISLAYTALRGDYIFAQRFWRTQAWLSSGLGNTRFSGQAHPSGQIGAGVSVQANDYFSCRLMLVDHVLKDTLFENSKISHTPEPSFGLAVHF